MQNLSDNPIVKDINMVVTFLSALVGVVIVGSLIWGGIQYAAAGDNPQAVNDAKQRITNSLLALLAYLLIFAFLQWLVPGGIFNQSGGGTTPPSGGGTGGGPACLPGEVCME